MEGVEPESESQGQDGQIASENSKRLAENLQGFQQCVKEILKLTKQEEDFSEVTAQIYDSKKSKLTELVTALSGMYEELVNQNIDLIREVSKTPPIKTHHVDSSTSTSSQVTQTSKTELDFSFNPSGGGFSFSPVKDDASKVKETKGRDPDVLLNKISSLEKEGEKMKKKIQDLEDANAILEAEKTNVADYESIISESNLRIETMRNVLEGSRKQVITAENEKRELSEKLESQTRLLSQFQSTEQTIASTMEQLALQQARDAEMQVKVNLGLAEISKRDNEIRELNAQITQQKTFHSEQEDKRNAEIEMLKTEIREKSELNDDLNQKHGALMSKTKQLKEKVVEFQREVDAMEVMLGEGTEAIRPKLDSKEAQDLKLYEEVNKFKAEILKRADVIEELKTNIVLLSYSHAVEEEMLKTEIGEKRELFDELNREHDALKSYTNELKAKVVNLARELMSDDGVMLSFSEALDVYAR